ncbi:hypothetical protein GCM10010168_67460 [Actinoplanes ianthinogenes]|uniref:Uncharacterized protein n=1 Tax=Actinoplanes ianthinogenes TaxID=122358 RepID=A0ABN6CHJ5_9ACTN|nr:hypothetical protein Aiant_46000 [Actinoplanes ianthinogenes]GGR39329.1 hypothetical protein GCM10010168_67460 [Actinoplanes ianthinogenes]
MTSSTARFDYFNDEGPMAEGVSPTVARRQTRFAFPMARERAGLTDLQVATETGWSPGVATYADHGAGAIQRAFFDRVQHEAADEETRSFSSGKPWKTVTRTARPGRT